MSNSILTSLGALVRSKRLTTIIPGLLGALKVITDAFGWHMITNPEINAITDGVAAVATIVSVIISHERVHQRGMLSTDASMSGSTEPRLATTNTGGQNRARSTPSVASPEAASDGYARP